MADKNASPVTDDDILAISYSLAHNYIHANTGKVATRPERRNQAIADSLRAFRKLLDQPVDRGDPVAWQGKNHLTDDWVVIDGAVLHWFREMAKTDDRYVLRPLYA